MVATAIVAQPQLTRAAEVPSPAQRCRAMNSVAYESINPRTAASLITIWPAEAAKAKAGNGFTTTLKPSFWVSRTSHAGLVGVHELYNPRTHDFLWTKSLREVTKETSRHGYVDGGTVFYAAQSSGSCLTAVHRYVRHGMHRYSATASQRAALARSGWRHESIAFYATGPKYGSSTATGSAKIGTTKPKSTSEPAKSTSKPAQSTSKPAKSSLKKSGTTKLPKKKTTTAKKTSGRTTSATSPTSGGPFSQPAYLFKGTLAWKAYQDEKNQSKKRLLYQIAATPTSIWLGGTSGDGAYVNKITTKAAALHQTPQFVLYAIPYRDCGSYSAGGLSTVAQYEHWVDSVKQGIGGRKAVVIVEPDAIGMGCLSSSRQAQRNEMLRYAMRTLSNKNVWVYIHAGSGGLNPSWAAAAVKKAGVSYGRGIAVNVSSFDSTKKEIAYGKAVIGKLGMNKHIIIDTSRNGLGRNTGSNGGAPGWCNPPGRALGVRPTSKTGNSMVDAYVWIKRPGESDGMCHRGDPRHWFQSYALDITQRALDHKIIARLPIPK